VIGTAPESTIRLHPGREKEKFQISTPEYMGPSRHAQEHDQFKTLIGA
jgi:hypothetical protein